MPPKRKKRPAKKRPRSEIRISPRRFRSHRRSNISEQQIRDAINALEGIRETNRSVRPRRARRVRSRPAAESDDDAPDAPSPQDSDDDDGNNGNVVNNAVTHQTFPRYYDISRLFNIIANETYAGAFGGSLYEQLREVYNTAKTLQQITPYSPIERNTSDTEIYQNYILNEFGRMYDDSRKANDIFPVENSDNEICFNITDVKDIHLYMMLYIIDRLIEKKHPTRSYFCIFRLKFGENQFPWFAIKTDMGAILQVVPANITRAQFMTIYDELMHQCFVIYDAFDTGMLFTKNWNGSEESGTRITISGMEKVGYKVKIKLDFTKSYTARIGHKWTKETEMVLQQSVGRSVLSVRNKNDNKCLIYCLIMGLIVKYEKGFARLFEKNNWVEDYEIYCKGSYMFMNKDDEISQLITNLTRLVLPATYSDGEVSDTVKFVEDLDKKATTSLSVEEFKKKFEEIETVLIPNKTIGVDVYGIDFNINRHIYPLYISKRREKLIELLCVTPKDSECSHFCVIVNMENLLTRSGGKQFWSCSKCGKTFYHKANLVGHKCEKATKSVYDVEGEGGYHYSMVGVIPQIDPVVGVCTKCRLCFTSGFQYQYHKDHCFMRDKTGYRHVQLVSYDPHFQPKLKGEEVDLVEEEKNIKNQITCRCFYDNFMCI